MFKLCYFLYWDHRGHLEIRLKEKCGWGLCGRKERRVGTKERELKRGHHTSILVVDGADYA